ncbi:MAG TPA: carboxymuconolactone decarboxylase family protein [Pseudonocardiaceae bacterium]|jgi:AhpD family alkylhydroperoxidase|nr:carboxymuconolactone decarboxylase family protein [Pseudonocardiaceae bacterium]
MRNPNRDAAVSRAFPEAFEQLLGLHKTVEAAAADAGIDAKLIELVKVRASQLNGCAYCLDMHSRDARELGEDERRLFVLPAWRETGSTGLFTEQERAALALTESMTTLAEHRDVPDDVYDRAAELFTERQLTVIVWAIAVINTFNRFGVTGRTPLPARR